MKKSYTSRYGAVKRSAGYFSPKSWLFSLVCVLGLSLSSFAQSYQRVYANSETHSKKQTLLVTLSEVQNATNATDGDPQTASTLRANVGALSLIQAWQNLRFTGADIPTATTPVTVKLGLGASVLDVLGGVTIQATLDGTPVGQVLDSASLVGLLGSDNQCEITFTPGVDYDGVRVTVKPTLSVGVEINLFHAYFLKAATAPVCNAVPLDVLAGAGKYLPAVDLGNFSSHVADPFNAIDGDGNTYATLHADVGVAAYTQETIIFSGLSKAGDSVRLLVSKPGGLLELDVLKKSVSIVTYNGNTRVDSLGGGASLLFLRLLSGAGNQVAISFASSGSFDRVQLRLGGVVSALSDLNLYEAQMIAPLPEVNIGGVTTDTATVCTDSAVVLNVTNPEAGTTYSWWSAATGGTQLASGTSYPVPEGQAVGSYKYYVQALRSGCTTATDRKEIVINVVEAASPTIIQPTADTTICLGQSVTLVASSAQEGATFNWYTTATGGTPLAIGKDTIHVTPSSSTTYYAETVLGNCASATRSSITVNVNPAPEAPQVLPDTAYVTIGQTATFTVLNPDNTLEYKWYPSAGQTSLHTGTSFTTPTITADTKYEVEASVPGGCISPRTEVVVIALPLPSDVSCNYANTQQSPVFTGGIVSVCLLCEVADPEYAVDGKLNTASNIRMNVGVSDYIGQLVKFQHQGKAGDSIRLILGLPTGLADVDLLSNVRIETYNGGAPSGSPIFLNSSLLRLTLLSGNKFAAVIPAGTDYDAVLVSLGGSLNVTALTTLNLYNAEQLIPLPAINGGKDTVSVCPNSPVTLAVTPGLGTTVTWYDAPMGGNELVKGSKYTTPAITDTTTYYIEAMRDGCANPNRVPIMVAPAPAPAVPQVVSDSIVICAGEQATLEVKDPQAGIKYVWYDVATGGTALDTADSYTTPSLGASQNYYVAAFSESCMVGSARAVAQVVTSTPPDTPVLVADTVYVLSGHSATFTVGDAGPGLVYRWYDAATNGNLLHSGTDFTTPPLTADAIYYVEAATAGGCISTSRTKAVVLMSAPSGAPCNTANEQQSPVFTGGALHLCLLCGVFDAPNAVDDDPTTASNIRMNVGVGVGSSYIGQLLKFQHQGKAGDSIRLILGLPTGLADVQLLGHVRIETYQGSTPSGKPVYLNSSLLRLTLLSGNKFEAVIPAAVDYDRVLVSIGGTLSALTTLNLYNAEQLIPLPVVSTDSLGICSGTKATLTVTGPQGVDIKWYDAATGGTLLATGTNFTTGALTATTTYYAESSRDGCPNMQRVPVTVTVGTPPAAPDVVSSGITICLGESATLEVKNPSDQLTYNWYDVSTGGSPLASDSEFTTPSLNNNKTYYVEAASAGGCVSPARTAVSVTVNPLPATPVVNPASASVPSGGTVQFSVANPVAGETYNWYSTISGGAAIYSGSTFTTPPLYSDAMFYVEAVNATGCASSARMALPVTVTGFSNVPCSFATSQETYSTGINIGSVSNAAQAVDANVNSASTITRLVAALGSFGQKLTFPFQGKAGDSIHIKLGGAGTNVLQLSLLDGIYIKTFNGTVDNNDALNIGTSSLVKLELLTVNSNTGMISFAASKDLTSVAVYSSSALNVDLGGGLKIYYASAVVPEPELQLATDTVCEGETVTLAVKNPRNDLTFEWYDGPVGGTLLHTGKTFDVNPSVSSTYYVQAVRTVDMCPNPNRKGAQITVDPRAKASDIDVTGDNPLCAGESATLQASSTTVTSPVFTWYSDAQLTNKIATGKNLTVTPTATTTYYVTVLGTGVCENAPGDAKPVTVTVNPKAQASDIDVAGNDPLCAGESATLQASSTTVTSPVFTWYSDAQLTNKIATGKNLTVTPTATTTYYVTVLGTGVCENAPGDAKTITVVVNEAPVKPTLKVADQVICSSGITSFEVSNPQTGVIYQWYADATGGTVLATGTTFTSTVLHASTAYYVEAMSISGCFNASGRTKATVTVTPPPDAPQVKVTDITACMNSEVEFDIDDPKTGYTYNWYTAAIGGVLLMSGKSFKTQSLTADQTYYVEAVSDQGCISVNRTKVTATIIQAPEVPVVTGNGTPICPGSTATLTASSTTPGVSFKWYDAETGGTLISGDNPFITPALDKTTTYYVEAVRNGTECVNATRTAVTVDVLSQLPPPEVKQDDADLSSITFTWSPVPGATGYEISLDQGSTWQQPSSGATGTSHVVSGLQPNQTVTIIVRALGQSACENSAPSAAVTGKTNIPPGNKFFVPNAFTPNGDGINDVWLVYGSSINAIHTVVYNQYGQLVFESRSQQNGWDGTYKGQMQPVGVYVYYVQITFLDGSKATKKGSVTIIR